MSGSYQVNRPPALPAPLSDTSHKRTQQNGQLSVSPLRFQRGFLKIPEGARQLASHDPWSSSYPPLTHAKVVSSALSILQVREHLAAQDTQALRTGYSQAQKVARWLRQVYAVLACTIGAGIVVSPFVLVPIFHLSSSVGLLHWEYLAAILGILGLGELSLAVIVRKTTAPHHR